MTDKRDLLAEIDDLRARLEEAEETLSAIRSGEIDALVVSSGKTEKIFTLEGADRPYRLLLETMSEGASTLSPDGAVLFCNRRLADLLGVSLEQILGKPLSSHVAPADLPTFTSLLEKALGGECRQAEGFRAELLLLTDKGDTVPVLLSCCCLDLTDNRGISVIVTDLSKQKRFEEIVAAGELASSILEQAGEAIIVCDEASRVIRASKRAHELFGINPMFRTFEHLGLLQESCTGRVFSISEPLAGQVCKGVEVVFERAGRPFHLLLSARPLYSQGKIRGCVVTLTDITDRKRAEEALKEAAAAAEDASRAKSEFLANMSHEIRTPMTVFLAALEHLLQLDKSQERRHLLQMADQSAKRLRALIDDILDFSRIEARRVELGHEPFDLVACLEEAVNMFALPVREKNLRLEMEIAAETPRIVIGDSDRIGQVLTNLIGNAVKFTHEGEIRVSVQPRDSFLEFAVADTGIGFQEQTVDLLFQSFSQADSSFTRQYGGTGLGLAICKSLVELMGGKIHARKRKDKGSVFIFTIPLLPAELEGLSIAGEQQKPFLRDQGTARILLADDEPLVQEFLVMMLTTRGRHVETARSGREAVQKWAAGDFDIILMDLQMPEMDGLEATRKIRMGEAEVGKRTCIIGLTAHARREIQGHCLAAGMDMVLTKPVKMTDLYAAIDGCRLE